MADKGEGLASRTGGPYLIPAYVRQRLRAVALDPRRALRDENIREELITFCGLFDDLWADIPAQYTVTIHVEVTWDRSE